MFDQESFDLGYELRETIHALNCFTMGAGYKVRVANLDRIKAAAEERGQVATVLKTIDKTHCEICWKRRENTDI